MPVFSLPSSLLTLVYIFLSVCGGGGGVGDSGIHREKVKCFNLGQLKKSKDNVKTGT